MTASRLARNASLPAPRDVGRDHAGGSGSAWITPWITPDWPAPPAVRVVTTTRPGGVSRAPYASLNLATGTGDAPAAVARNRAMVVSALGLDHEPCWLDQVHGPDVVRAARYATAPRADASVGDAGSPPCAVLTADCLPVVLCDVAGARIGIAHAGWRGLAGGVIERCVAAMERPAGELLAWLGPAIGAESYEVGPEVREACLAADPGAWRAFAPRAPDRDEDGSPAPTERRHTSAPPARNRSEACRPVPDRGEDGPPAPTERRHASAPPAPKADRWFADLYAIARRRLESLGIERVYGGGFCTCRDADRFFSYRRDGVTGRFATLVWIQPSRR